MEQSTAETVVKVVSILSYISAGLMLFAAFVMFIVAGISGSLANEPELAEAIAQEPGLTTMIAAFGILGGLFFLFWAGVEIAIGVGLWKHRNWGRILQVVVAWFSGVLSVLGLVSALASVDILGAFFNLVTAAFAAVLIWLFQFEPTVKGLFTTQQGK